MSGPRVDVSDAAVRWLARYSIDVLRICVGVVFLVFGALKLQPGASPVENLVIRTVHALTLGVVSGHLALLLAAEIEIIIGVTLISGRALKLGLAVLAVALVGILSPLVLFPSELFHGGVTLEAQYVFKDIVLVGAGLVVAAHTLGARLTVGTDVDTDVGTDVGARLTVDTDVGTRLTAAAVVRDEPVGWRAASASYEDASLGS